MTRPRYTEERFMSILWTLYERTSNGNKIIKYGHFCKEMNITNAMFPLLETHKVLVSTSIPSNTGRGKMQKVYVWNTIQPNIHMARKLMDEIKKRHKIANAKHKEKLEMLKKQEELDVMQNNEVQQHEVNWVVIDNETDNKSSYDYPNLKNPNTSATSEVTLTSSSSTDQSINTTKPKKKFSIAWGLISIEW